MSTPTPDERDLAALRRMLDHAPDHAARPDAQLRDAIRVAALAAVQEAAPTSSVDARDQLYVRNADPVPWHRRLKSWLGIDGASGSRGPWQAAFATVALAVLVTVMWQNEPTPGPQLDGAMEAPESAPVPAPAPAPVPTPTPTPEAAPAASAKARSPSTAADTKPATQNKMEAENATEKATATKKLREERARSDPTASAKAAAPAAEMAPAPAPPSPPVMAAPAAAPPASESLGMADDSRAEGPATPSRRAAAPVAAAPAAAAPAAPPAPRAAIAARPPFAALDAWTSLTLARPDGRSRSLTREQAGALAALLDSAARSAAGAGLADGSADWRISFERAGEVLATLELSGDTVRWRDGNSNGALRVGTPPAPLMEALRSALAQRLTGG